MSRYADPLLSLSGGITYASILGPCHQRTYRYDYASFYFHPLARFGKYHHLPQHLYLYYSSNPCSITFYFCLLRRISRISRSSSPNTNGGKRFASFSRLLHLDLASTSLPPLHSSFASFHHLPLIASIIISILIFISNTATRPNTGMHIMTDLLS